MNIFKKALDFFRMNFPTAKEGDERVPRWIPIDSKVLIDAVQKSKTANIIKYIENPSIALEKDPDIYFKMMRDATVYYAWQLSVARTVGLQWSITNKDLEKCFKSFVNWQDMLNWICEMDMNGLKLIKINYQDRVFEDVESDAIKIMKNEQNDDVYGILCSDYKFREIDPNLFLVGVYDDRQGYFGYGRGLRDAIFLTWWVYTQVYSSSVQAIERIGQPIVAEAVNLRKYASQGTDALKTHLTSELNALVDMSGSGAFVYDSENTLQILNPQPVNPVVLEIIRDLRNEIIKVILGATLNTGGENSAALGIGQGSEMADQQTAYLAQFRRSRIANVINKQLLPRLARAYGITSYQPTDEFMWMEPAPEKNYDAIRANIEVLRFMAEQKDARNKMILRNEYYEMLGGIADPLSKPGEDIIILETTPAPTNSFFGQRYQGGEKTHDKFQPPTVPHQQQVFLDAFEAAANDILSKGRTPDINMKLAEHLAKATLLADMRGRVQVSSEQDRLVDRFSVNGNLRKYQVINPPADFWNEPFKEAADDLMERVSEIVDFSLDRPKFKQIQDLYEKHGFGLAKSTSLEFTQKVQSELYKSIMQGEDRINFMGFMKANSDFAISYSENVYETNLATAQNAGRWRQAMAAGDLIAAWEFSSVTYPLQPTKGGVRPSHFAHNGMIARIENPIWNKHSPPLGYRCRCFLLAVLDLDFEREKIPGNLPAADYSSFGGRPDKAIYGGIT